MLGQLSKEEQVQVVIRLKPVPKEQIITRSVYVSDQQDKTLVVETPNKKEYFVFDNIADDQCSQQEIYQSIGQDAVKSSTDGYNCCIFAYGQTGTGKSYSILGNSSDILNDIYAQSRGILPRLLSDLFSWCQNETNRFWIKCSYLEIYNEQIIDLLNPDLKLRQIRQDFKRGVFVQGLSQENATNYEDAMAILMRGVKNRKTSATSMNDESSRSHTIFTLYIESEIVKNDITKTRRSKINIVDLAGSERAKHTKVQGDRLKQGCNINRSLHVLGNVINALVQSAKKKKHIPFRDSKLTHFLKDSLSGNSITKLLANIHPSKAYLGDTLSTLMFAKRAKILKMKVEVNENMTQNFEQLRKQIRKLREELAEARYIKNQDKSDQNANESQTEIQNTEKTIDISQFDNGKHQKILRIFEQNEINYKSLIEIYEQHLKNCTMANKAKKSLNMHQEWKNLQKKNAVYFNLLKGMPAFTKIFKQNVKLKRQQKISPLKQNVQTFKQLLISCNQKQDPAPSSDLINQIKLDYQTLIKSIEAKFTKYMQELESAYEDLEIQNRQKDEKIKELKKRKELPPDLEQLVNDNEYLKLNILELEDQINSYEEKERKFITEIKELKREKQLLVEKLEEGGFQTLFPKLIEIKQTFEKESNQHEEEINSMLSHFDNMKDKLISSVQDNKNLSECLESLKQDNKGLKKKLNSLLKISDEMEITKDQNTNTFWTNEQSNISEEFEIFNEKNKFFEKEPKTEFQREEQKLKGIDLSNQIIKLHKSYNEQINRLKQQIKNLERASKRQPHDSKSTMNQQTYTAEKLNSNQLSVQEPVIIHTRSSRTLGKFKEPDTAQYMIKYGFNQEKDGHSAKGSPHSAKTRKGKGTDDRFPK